MRDETVPPTCPFCESEACRVVGSVGIGNQVSLVRCTDCDSEWEEILMFRYRRPRRETATVTETRDAPPIADRGDADVRLQRR